MWAFSNYYVLSSSYSEHCFIYLFIFLRSLLKLFYKPLRSFSIQFLQITSSNYLHLNSSLLFFFSLSQPIFDSHLLSIKAKLFN